MVAEAGGLKGAPGGTGQGWRFPRAFWIGNAVELCERAAYYGTFIALTLYLTRVVGLSDVEAGWVAGPFAALIYFLPFFTGAAADRMGFRPSLMLAFALLGAGYGMLGFFHTLPPVLVGLALIVVGGSFVKPVITGTVAKSSGSDTRARAFSLFYMMVNIGSFTGKTVVAPMRIEMGIDQVPFFSSGASLFALLLVALLFFPKDLPGAERPRTVRDTLRGMGQALSNLRFVALVFITAGFWAIQGQLYASMPVYVLRMAGEKYKPEWYANINPLVVVLGVVLVTQLIRRWRPEVAIAVAMGMIPFSSLIMAAAHLYSRPLVLMGHEVHPITAMMVLGIALQGLAECFLSPKYLEYASKQAPPGQEGLYMGFSHMNTTFAWLFGFVFAGYLLRAYCPEPSTLGAAVQAQHALALKGLASMPEAYAHAHYLWYAFSGVGFVAFAALLLFVAWTTAADRRKARP
jgi:dipeptide/tripeptide permease